MTAIAHRLHRVTSAVAGARAELAAVAEAPVWSMDAEETVTSIEALAALAAQVTELQCRVLAHADRIDLAAQSGATSTATWLAHRTTSTKTTAHRAVRLASALGRHELTRAALAAGEIHVEQAEAVVRAVEELPAGLDSALVEEAEAHLVAEADRFDAKALRHLGRRLLEAIDPDVADAHEAALLEREEREATAAQRFTMTEDGHGRVHGRFTLDAATGAMLKKALLALAAPKHRAASGPLGERRPSPKRLGAAFAELVQRYPTDRLPDAGGVNATVVVLLDHDSLVGGLKAAGLDTGETISASLARRLACEAKIIPAVLGGKSEVLDLGRTRRFHSKAQRTTATIEQRHCNAAGCDYPPGLCHMHHPQPWSRGGTTGRDGLLLCPRHHHLAHDPSYQMAKLPSGRVEFTRRN